MMTLLRKSRSTSWSTEAIGKPRLKLLHFVNYWTNPLSVDFDHVVFVAYVGLVLDCEKPFTEGDESPDLRAFCERLPNVVDRGAFVKKVLVLKEEDAAKRSWLGGDVNEFALGCSPDGMGLRFDHYLGPMPDGPAKNLFSTLSRDVLFDDLETIVDFGAKHGLNRHIVRANAGADAMTEGPNG